MTIKPKVKLRFISATPDGRKSIKYEIYNRPPEIRINFKDWVDEAGEPISRSFRRTGPDEYTELPEPDPVENITLIAPNKKAVVSP
jgi:hypothetical protein